jgi:hypothetical protein
MAIKFTKVGIYGMQINNLAPWYKCRRTRHDFPGENMSMLAAGKLDWSRPQNIVSSWLHKLPAFNYRRQIQTQKIFIKIHCPGRAARWQSFKQKSKFG